jgi:hypothetical protein
MKKKDIEKPTYLNFFIEKKTTHGSELQMASLYLKSIAKSMNACWEWVFP